ncbi:hypothetical protein ACVGXS_00005 [Enterobacter hormaechei]
MDNKGLKQKDNTSIVCEIQPLFVYLDRLTAPVGAISRVNMGFIKPINTSPL